MKTIHRNYSDNQQDRMEREAALAEKSGIEVDICGSSLGIHVSYTGTKKQITQFTSETKNNK